MAGEYIFTMRDLRKVVPPSREILKGIYLSFYPGAKIGVLGANGAGKSSLLRIMAGVDNDFLGDARPLPGIRIGFLPQEPQLDSDQGRPRQRRGWRGGAARAARPSSTRSAPSSPSRWTTTRWTRLLEKQGNLQERIDALGLWELDHKIDIAMDALRLPPGDADVDDSSPAARGAASRCAGCCCEQPDMLLLDEPTNHLDAESVAWLERYLAEFPGTVVAVTHDRYFLDNVAKWILELDRGAGHSVGGQLLLLARAEAAAPGTGGEAGLRPAEDARSASWSGCAWRRARGRPRARPASPRYEELREEAERQTEGSDRDPDPGARAAGRRGRDRDAASPRATATGCCSRT